MYLSPLQLHTISGKDNVGQEGKAGPNEFVPNVAPIHTEMKSPRDVNVDSLSNSPIVFSDTLKSKFGRSLFPKIDNSNINRAESQQDNNIDGLKAEWVEQYEPVFTSHLQLCHAGKKGLNCLDTNQLF